MRISDWSSDVCSSDLIILLIAELRLEKVVAVGTSLGGILTMLLAATDRERLAGAVLNDVGPVLDPAGLERIRTYVGRSQNWPTRIHAARALAELNATVYPRYEQGRVGKGWFSPVRFWWLP